MAAVLALLTSLPAGATDARLAAPPSLEAVIDASHEALRKILNGDPSGYAARFADRDDTTLGNPFEPFGKGRDAVQAALRNASPTDARRSTVRDGRPLSRHSFNALATTEGEFALLCYM